MELTAGMKLGIFTIIRQIGAGGMSEVYLVRDDLDRVFALKTMSSRISSDPTFRQRFQQEARIMASLTHPNIVQLHSYFEAEGRFCLVMEYVEGGSLGDLCRRIGPIPEKRALNILGQIAEALSYAHSKGITHRDVKPSNILLDENDNVKVMDFGIARMTEGPGLTQTGTQMGTLVYMSPEQIKDSKYVDERTDIYSLGVSFYEMLTGRPPYDERNSNDFEIRENIIYKALPDPRKVYPYIGNESLRLIAGLTRKKPEERLPLSTLLTGGTPEIWEQGEQPETKLEIPKKKETPSQTQNQKKPSTILLVSALILLVVIGSVYIWQLGKEKKVGPGDVIVNPDSIPKPKPEIPTIPGMVFVEGGTFMMGSNDGGEDEEPIHEVNVSSFWIGKYQVTQKEWVEVMGSNPSRWKGDRLPVENVSWYDAVEYCNERSIREGLTPCYSGSGINITCDWNANGYRLPTEAEWEYAARGGMKSRGYKYSGSNDLSAVAWYRDNSGKKTHETGTKSPNELGIHDMSGNVWEWCWDIYGSYPSGAQTNPHDATSGTGRVLRGGCWVDFAVKCTVSYRSSYDAAGSGSYLGFRACRVSP